MSSNTSDNTLKTVFIFDSETGDQKVDLTGQKLFALNTDLNNLGKGLTFGKTVNNDLSLAGKSVDGFKNKVSDLSKPTSGGGVSLAGKLRSDFDVLSKRVEDTRRQFGEITKIRFDNGNIGNLSREIITAQNHSRILAGDIVKIQKELANPNRTTSITFLTASLRAAEEEADRLNRKLNSLPTGAGGANGRSVRTGTNNLKLSGFQKQNLSYQINDVVTGLASGQNPTQILAQQSGQIAQIFSGEQIAAFTAKYAGLVSVLGAGAAAIALTYKITGDIRKQAEHYLEVQTKITGELNKQRLAAKELERDFAEQRANAARSDNFSRSVANDSFETLIRRKKAIEQSLEQSKSIQTATFYTSGENSERYKAISNNIANEKRELLDVEQRLRESAFDRNNKILQPGDSFNKRFADYQNSERDRFESQRRYAKKLEEYNKRRSEDLEKTKSKIKDLDKLYSETYDNLFQKRLSDNPFVSLFSEADKATRSLRENLRGLSPELQAVAGKIQQKLNADSMFNARLDNDFAAFDLRQKASDLRDFKSPKIGDTDKFFKDFIADATEQAIAANGGSPVRYNRLATGGFAQSSIENEFTTNFSRVSKADGTFGGFVQSPKTFKDLTEREKFDFLNRDNVGAQKRLGAAFDLATSRRASNDEQQSSIGRKIVSLSAGFRSEQFTDSQRDIVARAAENEAKRKDDYERKAQQQRDEQTKIQSKIADELRLLREKAEKDGFGAIEQTLRIITDGDGVSAQLQKSANANDTKNAYRGGTFYEDYENQ